MNNDEKVLVAATEIMELLNKPMPFGQLKANVQCTIIELLEEKDK